MPLPSRAVTALATVLSLASLACGEAAPGSGGAPAAGLAEPAPAAVAAEAPGLPEGFVVWESNRGGAWRLWIRELAGGPPRQLTADEPGRAHCCPHVAPDGRFIAYLSLPAAAADYPLEGAAGPLRLVRPNGRGERELAAVARTYWEHRAVVWRSPRELIYIGGDGRARLLDWRSGEGQTLTSEPQDAHGWLLSPTLEHAVWGRPEFSPVDPATGTIARRTGLGGCQPYFSGDGRWGFWVAGTGGPIKKIDLASGELGVVLRKNDERLGGGPGYLYFPMYSHDGRLFAVAGSDGAHDHMAADYEVWVAESDPATLELIGPPVRMTHHQATDRFPDVWAAPLPLGRHRGEAPLALRLEAPAPGSWSWELGDGGEAAGAAIEHVYRQPGVYGVRARLGERELAGRVVVAPPAPPAVEAARLFEEGAVVRLTFDEPIDATGASFAFASGLEVASSAVVADGRTLEVRPSRPVRGFETLVVENLADRAAPPNRGGRIEIELEPPLWPADRTGLAMVWETGDAANLVWDEALGVERASILTARGRAHLDGHFAMALRGGAFVAPAEQANSLRWALQSSNELTLEAVVTPARSGEDACIVCFSQGGAGLNFALVRRQGQLAFYLRMNHEGPEAAAEQVLGPLASGETAHVAVTYLPGRLRFYRDGQLELDTDAWQGDFFHWRSFQLTVGDEWGGGQAFHGTVEHLAIYERVLGDDEVAENAARAANRRAARPAVAGAAIEARLVRRSTLPTLDEIQPYREALTVYEWEVERSLTGDPPAGPLRIAHWTLLDGTPQPEAAWQPGHRARLELEPLAAQPQLESVYLADTLGTGGEIFYAGL